ncbi:MAG: hypothetical protein KFF77_00435 [Bacteroidetes bacterium]|nr:hypothetical protein [Bacteroidota bacterium]
MKHPRRKLFPKALLRGCLFFVLGSFASLFVSTHPTSAQTASAQKGASGQNDVLRLDHSVALFAGINEDAQVFLSPQSPDPSQRKRTEALGSAWSAALSYRYRLLPTLAVDVRGEYVSVSRESTDAIGTPIVHGIQAVLFESSALFALPFSTRRFEPYVGGGLGVHVGRREYGIAGVMAQHVAGTPAIGLHVTVGAEYVLAAGIGLRFEAIFRDPLMGVENRFNQPSVSSNGVNYPLYTEPFRSNVNLNGNVYSLGIFSSF